MELMNRFEALNPQPIEATEERPGTTSLGALSRMRQPNLTDVQTTDATAMEQNLGNTDQLTLLDGVENNQTLNVRAMSGGDPMEAEIINDARRATSSPGISGGLRLEENCRTPSPHRQAPKKNKKNSMILETPNFASDSHMEEVIPDDVQPLTGRVPGG